MRSVAPAPHLRRAGILIVAASLIGIAITTLMPEPGTARGSHFCLLCGSLGGVSAFLNVLLFVPLGVGLAVAGLTPRRAILCAMLLSLFIESTQLVAIPGRYATIGDVITNTLGGALGFALARSAPLLLHPSRRGGLRLLIAWALIWLAAQTVQSFGFSVSLPNTTYYGQIARRVGNRSAFNGSVRAAAIGDLRIPDGIVSNSPYLRRSLRNGGTVSATIVASGRTSGIAPIVRIADDGNREVLLLAESANDLVFAVRTGAQVLRLRPPLFALPDAFSSGSDRNGIAQDTIHLSGRYARGIAAMSSETSRRARSVVLEAGTSLGWALLMPFEWVIGGTVAERAASCLWIACLLAPLGFWAAAVIDGGRQPMNRTRLLYLVIAFLVLLVVGLIVIPGAFAVATATKTDWIAAVVGAAVGYGISNSIRDRWEHRG